MAIFNSYVSLPEGNIFYPLNLRDIARCLIIGHPPIINNWKAGPTSKIIKVTPCVSNATGITMLFGFQQDIGNIHRFNDSIAVNCSTTGFIWRFPKIGLPPVIIHFRLRFSVLNHPAIGISPFMETTILTSLWVHRYPNRARLPR